MVLYCENPHCKPPSLNQKSVSYYSTSVHLHLHLVRGSRGRFLTTPDDKMPHTNVVEGGLERPNHSPSSSRPHISTSTPGPGPTRAHTVGPVVNTGGHAPPARLRARPRSSRPCASNAARSRGQEGMRWSPGGARANICGAPEDPGRLRESSSSVLCQPCHIK